MRAALRTAFELVLLGSLSLALGFGVNAVRGKHIELKKNYFDRGRPSRGLDLGDEYQRALIDDQREKSAVIEGQIPKPGPVDPQLPPEHPTSDSTEGAHLDHDYQTISVQDVAAILDDPTTAQGLNVFIDARDDDHFNEGHIPGAVQFYPYQVDRFLDEVLLRTNGVENVIVYCGGGDCEDSIFACRELVEAGVPYEAIYLFEGGWEEWTSRNLPIEDMLGEQE